MFSRVLLSKLSTTRRTVQLKGAAPVTAMRLFSEDHSGEHSVKGSFLLVDENEKSDAAKLLKETSRMKGSKENEKIGRELIKQRNSQMSSNVSVFYKQDGGLVITKAKGCFMVDAGGGKHLDCANNVACVGHSHPRVVAAGRKHLGLVQTNGRFLNPVQQRYLAKLLKTLPPELDTIFMVNSGTEANDLALRIARAHTTAKRPQDVICMESAYHGHSQAIVDISPYKWYQAVDGKNYQPSTTHVAPCPDGYRGKYRLGQTEECGAKYAADVEAIVNGPGGGVGTFICESIIGCGGQIVPPPGYLERCYKAVRAKGGVVIADEVQTGFARCGSHFWTFQSQGVVPDIVSFGKPMGNGYPVAGIAVRRELADSFAASGIEYFNTYGGNSVACGIAEAVLDTIEIEDLQGNALRVGEYLTKRLQAMKEKFKCVGDVRGMGLFQGIEFVYDRRVPAEELAAHPDLTKFVVDFLKFRHVVISRDGPDGNVIKVKPPLVFSEKNVDVLVNCMEKALRAAKKLKMY